MNVQEAISHLVTVTESLQGDRTRHERRIQCLEQLLVFAYGGITAALLLIAVISFMLAMWG